MWIIQENGNKGNESILIIILLLDNDSGLGIASLFIFITIIFSLLFVLQYMTLRNFMLIFLAVLARCVLSPRFRSASVAVQTFVPIFIF
jgi:hypothetical protein